MNARLHSVTRLLLIPLVLMTLNGSSVSAHNDPPTTPAIRVSGHVDLLELKANIGDGTSDEVELILAATVVPQDHPNNLATWELECTLDWNDPAPHSCTFPPPGDVNSGDYIHRECTPYSPLQFSFRLIEADSNGWTTATAIGLSVAGIAATIGSAGTLTAVGIGAVGLALALIDLNTDDELGTVPLTKNTPGGFVVTFNDLDDPNNPEPILDIAARATVVPEVSRNPECSQLSLASCVPLGARSDLEAAYASLRQSIRDASLISLEAGNPGGHSQAELDQDRATLEEFAWDSIATITEAVVNDIRAPSAKATANIHLSNARALQEADPNGAIDSYEAAALVAYDSFALCGNNSMNAGESCDDGNRLCGDGCDSTCAIESVPLAIPALPARWTLILLLGLILATGYAVLYRKRFQS